MSTWESNYLAHHGIKGQKWGVRRFQNEDGSLTEAGKDRYYVEKGYKQTYSSDPEKSRQIIEKHMTEKGKGKKLSPELKSTYYDMCIDWAENNKEVNKYLDEVGKELVKDLNNRYDRKKNPVEYEEAVIRYTKAYHDISWKAVEMMYEQVLDEAEKQVEHGYLIHYGVKGQKKGQRRFQNEDGSYTEEGKAHYGIGEGRQNSGKSEGIKLNMDKQGMYGVMKNKRQMRRYLKDSANMQKESAKAGGDEQYKSDIKKIRKDYKSLAREYSHKKFNDVNKVELAKREHEIDERAAKALGDYIQRNRKTRKDNIYFQGYKM